MGQIDKDGNIKMVDVTGKSETHRTARGHARVWMNSEAFQMILNGSVKKGDVLTSAKIAGIMAAKKTGVEMEALIAASTAALTIYDMAKSVDKTMRIGEIYLLEKSGGKSGHYVRKI